MSRIETAAVPADGGRPVRGRPPCPPRGRPAAGAPKKAVLISMLPKELPYLDRFQLARGRRLRRHRDADDRRTPKEAEDDPRRLREVGPAHPLGDELRALELAALERRSRGREQERRRHGDVAAQREALGRGHRAARARGRQPADLVPGRLDAVAEGHPRAHPAPGRGAQGRRRRRGGLEQVPPEPARVRPLRGRVRARPG